MKSIDIKFTEKEICLFQQMIGKKMIKYKCDPFEFSTSVYGIVGFEIENESYAFVNQTKAMDYFGKLEDVALLELKSIPYTKIQSFIQNQTMIETPVQNSIKEITIVNETQKLFENGIQIYEVSLTRGIIFKFDNGYEISFEKDIWFSEDIIIQRGYDLISRLSPTDVFCEGWSDEFYGECYRETITLI